MANGSTGIIGAYVTAGNEWATVGSDGRVDALTTYASDINSAAAGAHVKVSGAGTTTLAASATRATLNLQNSGTAGTLDIGFGRTLTLSDGGILSSGTAAGRIENGVVRAGGNELIVTNRNDLTIASAIGETTAGTGLTKTGAGTLTVTGVNTYSGTTAITEGRLAVSSDANLGTGSTVQFNGGTLVATQSFSSTKALKAGSSSATIDTAGFNVAFSGASTGVYKSGAGTLTLSNPSAGTVTVAQGTLILPNTTSGFASLLSGGTLQTAGSLSNLEFSADSTLDIGGAGAASLTTSSVSYGSAGPLTVRFDLGISSQDLWTISSGTSFFSHGTGTYLFDFRDLGGVAIGTSYTLVNVPTVGPTSSASFALAPGALAAGWNGTFSVANNKVSITFASTPEPGSALLLATGTLLLGTRRRRR